YGVNASASTPANVAEAPYFAELMGKNTPGNGLGFTKYTVSSTRIDVQTSFSGGFSDSFSIANGANPIPVASWSPLAPQIGKATNPSSIGADYSGGGYELAGNLPYGSNPDNWPYSKRALQPPCTVNGVPTFVELHNVTLTAAPSVATYDCRNYYNSVNGGTLFPNGQNCDIVFNISNPSATTCPSCYMHSIYTEIDGDWNAS